MVVDEVGTVSVWVCVLLIVVDNVVVELTLLVEVVEFTTVLDEVEVVVTVVVADSI